MTLETRSKTLEKQIINDGWRGVSKEARMPLTKQWQEHIVEFEIKNMFQDATTLRFRLPHDVKGTFALANPRLKVAK